MPFGSGGEFPGGPTQPGGSGSSLVAPNINIEATNGAVQISGQGTSGRVDLTNPGSNQDITIDAGSGGTGASLLLIVDGNGGLQIYENGTGTDILFIPNMPTADPHQVGQWWNSAGTVKVSAG